ncbi:hypothetical protein NC653_025694 [Populus alba x Populus x berolinensis]|uniref:Uncharacterized protein n=1 Tax=Populus alba x Populus x berolinensis TaxID=444605 RepID=A0AAD6Q811_9ROSI|nr:hypothetical protein NC653_025694 [Populus alba x Populus x berolinensis]
MGKYGLFDLEKHFAFYGAYHSNPINILIHMIFVWPIFFATSLILYFTPPLFNLPQVELSLFGSNDVVLFLNIGFFLVIIYALFYICLDPKAGSLAALFCVVVLWLAGLDSLLLGRRPVLIVNHMFPVGNISYFTSRCILFQSNIARLEKCRTLDLNGSIEVDGGSNLKKYHKVLRVGSKQQIVLQVVLVAQIICWTGQFIGHGVFEKRAPALLDNLVQAFVMAPFFVLLEALQTSFGYEPYPGFHVSVQAKIDAEIKEWKEKKLKLLS